MDERTLRNRAIAGLAQLGVAMALALFLSAGTWRWMLGWLYLLVFLGASSAVTAHLMRHDRALLERRVSAGPTAEARPMQKVIQAAASLAFLAMLIVPGLDARRHWSSVPLGLSLLGDALVLVGFWVVFQVFRANSYTAATVEVAEAQTLVTTGPYAVVRHPMYAGALLLMLGTPIALGSWWGLAASAVLAGAIVVRLLDEERLLTAELSGYVAYRETTRYRLIPYVW